MDKNNTKKEAAPGSGFVMPINLSVSTDDLELGQGENVELLRGHPHPYQRSPD